jgi:hypothetical protein
LARPTGVGNPLDRLAGYPSHTFKSYLLKHATEALRYPAKRDFLDVVAVDSEFLIALNPHERSMTKFFIVGKPLERLKFAPAQCKVLGVFDSNPCRYVILSKHSK